MTSTTKMASTTKDVGLGKVGSNSHPLHPATVHFPITFLLASSILDIVTFISLASPILVYPLIKIFTSNTIAFIYYTSALSYASLVAGILTSMPALITGIIELYAMTSGFQNLSLSTLQQNSKIRTTVIHAGLNDVAVFAAAYNWWTRRGIEGYKIEPANVFVSVMLLGGILYSAYLGGSLVYTHGVGVQRMGKGGEIKEQMTKETKKQGKKEL